MTKQMQGMPYPVPVTASEHRQFENWLGEISRRPYATSGIDLEMVCGDEPGIGDWVQLTVEAATELGLPIQRGAILRLAAPTADRMLAYVMPRQPSLLPADGVWLPFEWLEKDHA